MADTVKTPAAKLRTRLAAAMGGRDTDPAVIKTRNTTLVLPASSLFPSLAAHRAALRRCRMINQSGARAAAVGFLPWDFVLGHERLSIPAAVSLFTLPADLDGLNDFVNRTGKKRTAPPALDPELTSEIFGELHRLRHSLVNIVSPLRITLEDAHNEDPGIRRAVSAEWLDHLADTPERPSLAGRFAGIQNGWERLVPLLDQKDQTDLKKISSELARIIAAIESCRAGSAANTLPPPSLLPELDSLVSNYGKWLANAEKGVSNA